jgi:hypothetical protein
MRRTTRSALALLVALVAAFPAAAAPQNSPIALTLAIDGPVPAGQKAAARLRIRNTSGHKLKFSLQERDIYDRPLAFPVGLKARVVDASGVVLTESERAPSGWWSAHELINPHMLVKNDPKRIEMRAGEEIERKFTLNDVVAGSPKLGAGFAPGTYQIQVSLNGVDSNTVTLEVTR